MWGSIANLKENLNKIALDVHQGDDDDDEIYATNNENDSAFNSPISDRRNSHRFAHSKFPSRSPLSNGIHDSSAASSPEIEQYKSEIKRLQASEAEIKALSVNYASLLKDKEDLIVRLNRENGSLKQNLEATSKASSLLRNDSSASSSKGTDPVKGSSDQVSNRQHKYASHAKNRHAGSLKYNGVVSRKDSMSNGSISSSDYDAIQNEMEPSHSDFQGKDKEVAVLVDGRNGSTVAAEHISEVRKLKTELEQERDKLAKIQMHFQAEVTLNKSLQEELKVSKMEIEKTSKEMGKIRDELNERGLEIKRLQMELSRREYEDVGAVDSLKRLIKSLEKENVTLKVEKKELEAALDTSKKSFTVKMSAEASQKDSSSISEMPDSSIGFAEREEMERSLQKLSKDLKETQRERDKALQQLARLKQHLLEKESEESQKMDEDSKIIEELRESNTFLRAQISHLEKSLKQAIQSHEELKMANSGEVYKSREIIDDLNKKLANCTSVIDAKNTELLNLQTALGQYYAEIEAKEHLEEELAHAREESARLSQQLKDVDQRAVVLTGERDEILAKLSQSEKAQSEWRSRLSKIEEDNAKLRRALEQSMTRLNRMSVDSDFLVDRRIVIKLLVTYFQRNHSKEVLDLMVRMLGFSDEDKQRIGIAQQGAGRGVVRGVLGLPGRLVGGILSGSPTEAAANGGSENQSFADMWVDFLLKETEEREKRDAAENSSTGKPTEGSHGSPSTGVPPFSNRRLTAGATSDSPMTSSSNHNPSPPLHGYFPRSDRLSSEFSTVPLSPSDNYTTRY